MAIEKKGSPIVFTTPAGDMLVMDARGDLMPGITRTILDQSHQDLATVAITMYCNVAQSEEHARKMLEDHKIGRTSAAPSASHSQFVTDAASKILTELVRAGDSKAAIISYHKAVKWNDIDVKLAPDDAATFNTLLSDPAEEDKILSEWYTDIINISSQAKDHEKLLKYIIYALRFNIKIHISATSTIPVAPAMHTEEEPQELSEREKADIAKLEACIPMDVDTPKRIVKDVVLTPGIIKYFDKLGYHVCMQRVAGMVGIYRDARK